MNKLTSIKKKMVDLEELGRHLAIWNLFDKKVVFTTGCFDILHRGHIEYLTQAASLGDVLIVGLQSDSSVLRLKGEGKLIQDQESRAMMVAAMSFVDAVIINEEDSPYNLIKFIQPNVLVKGADQLPKDIVGYDIVSSKGGKVLTLDIKEGLSTKALLDSIRK